MKTTRNRPDCPRCDDDILVLITNAGKWARLFCRECGWSYLWMPPPDDMDAAIAEAVAPAQEAMDNNAILE